jgi:hypothetical protein
MKICASKIPQYRQITREPAFAFGAAAREKGRPL